MNWRIIYAVSVVALAVATLTTWSVWTVPFWAITFAIMWAYGGRGDGAVARVQSEE